MEKLLRIIGTILIFLLLFVGYYHTITATTQDLGRHIATGNLILQTKSVPKVNLYSYTYPDFPFINHHYLSEVLFALTYRLSGYHGLLLLTTLLIMAAFSFVFFSVFKKVHLLTLGISSLLLLRVLFERTDLRPEIFSFLFFSALLTILYAYRQKTSRLIFLLIPLQLLWVNMHIYFFVGLSVIGLFLFDIFLQEKSIRSRKVKLLGLVFTLCLLVSFFNPNGIDGALYPLHAMQNYGYTIEENQNIFFLESLGFQKPAVSYFKISVILLFLGFFFSFKKTTPIDWLLASIFTLFGAYAVRNLPLFAFAVFIPFTLALDALVKQLLKRQYAKVSGETVVFLGTIIVFTTIFWQSIAVAKTKEFGFRVEKGAEKAADFFLREKINGPIFNNFDIGSYLDFRLYPQESVFVDGRPEAYPASFFQQVYIPMQEQKNLFEQYETKYNFNVIFFSHTDQTPWAETFLRQITHDVSWKPVYLDDYAIILAKNTPQNKNLLAQHAIDLRTVPLTVADASEKSLLQLASFFSKIGIPEQEITLYQMMLKKQPNNCPALYNISILYRGKNQQLANIFLDKYDATCR